VLDELELDPAVQSISDWLVHQGLWRADVPTLLGGYCERLVAAGVPIWRGYLSALTLHPRVRGVGLLVAARAGRPERALHLSAAAER
jgi:adenylate cyclase